MSTGGATPPAPAAPGLLRSLATSLAGPLVMAAILIGYYESCLKPAPPTPPALATLVIEYRAGQAAALRRTADAIDGRATPALTTSAAIVADLATHGAAIGVERDRLLKAAADASGNITAPALISGPLRAAADLIEGKTAR